MFKYIIFCTACYTIGEIMKYRGDRLPVTTTTTMALEETYMRKAGREAEKKRVAQID